MQNIHFDDFKTALIYVEDEKEEGVGNEEEEQVDTSPWAGTDRDYSYEEVREVMPFGKGSIMNQAIW